MNILLVDDEPHVRESMAKMIAGAFPEFELVEAEDGEEAVSKLQDQRFDLVITDLRMPAMNGLELSKYIQEHWEYTIIVMLTGHAEFQYAQSAIRYGVRDYLLKPASADQIKEVIMKANQMTHTFKKTEEVGKHRTKTLMEKRIQDLFYELPLPYYDEPLFCPFGCMAVYSFMAGTQSEQERTSRFAIKNIIEDVLSEYGTSVVTVGDQAITGVLILAEGATVRTEELAEIPNIVKHLAKTIMKLDVQASFGGVTEKLDGISQLYEESLKPFTVQTDHEPDHVDVDQGDREQVHHNVRMALQYIHERYAEELSLTSIAAELYVSPNYLSGLFKTETGSTFTHHLMHIRMEQAKRLLLETNLKIYEICTEVGYSDQAHFSRMFKMLEGMTPYEYRRTTNS